MWVFMPLIHIHNLYGFLVRYWYVLGRRGVDDAVSLKEKRFIIGDYLSIAITPPMGNNRSGPGRMRPF